MVCDLLLKTFYAGLMFLEARKYNYLQEIFLGKMLVVCNIIMIQKLVVSSFFFLKKLVGFMS